MKILLALLPLLVPAAAQAADSVSLVSQVLVERVDTTPEGQTVTTRGEPDVVTPGDRLLFVLSYRNNGAQPATTFVLTNPVPDSVAFAGTDDASAVVSVDGSKTWGPLSSLTVIEVDGTMRPAEPADVTHVRWSLAEPVPSGGAGELSFRGVVK
ncbi:MAG TPA: hypothetical protein VEB68_01665 [Croceibacterium sp.]|nr:hypothetical protein [Croceibacterium sp.]